MSVDRLTPFVKQTRTRYFNSRVPDVWEILDDFPQLTRLDAMTILERAFPSTIVKSSRIGFGQTLHDIHLDGSGDTGPTEHPCHVCLTAIPLTERYRGPGMDFLFASRRFRRWDSITYMKLRKGVLA